MDGRDVKDSEGTELASLDVAKAEALKLSGAVLGEADPDAIWAGRPWEMTVTDGAGGLGHVFFKLNFTASAVRQAMPQIGLFQTADTGQVLASKEVLN